jgi:hypothetical protein
MQQMNSFVAMYALRIRGVNKVKTATLSLRDPCKEIKWFWSGTSQCLFPVLMKYKPVYLTYLLQKAIICALSTAGS